MVVAGQRVILTDDYVVEELKVFDRTYQYKQIESSFTQPNAQVCQKMLEWACNASLNSLIKTCSNCTVAMVTYRLYQQNSIVLATEL